ncbi:MAG: radical SAM protein [Planctomycetota bacterium]|nr:radical SAM protein [Planctomycetota bacterium]
MTVGDWHLPWQGEQIPHAVLDLLRGCNITCRACYNTEPANVKSLDEVRQELQVLTARRRLDSISLLGGEPTLHPRLCDIVHMIKTKGISVELFTNGLLLEPALLAELRRAGTDLVFLHIDSHQTRPDLGDGWTADGLRELRARRAAAVAAAGMEVGLTMTAYEDALPEIDEAVRFVLASPHVDYLLATLFRDVPAMGAVVGDLDVGMRAVRPPVVLAAQHDRLTNEMVCARLAKQFGLRPFANLGSSRDPDDPRWVSYLAGSLLSEGETPFWTGLRVSAAERLFLAVYRFLRRRYPFYIPQSPGRFRLQLLLNAVTGGVARGNLALLIGSLKKGSNLRAKRLLLQCPAEVAGDGTIVHCAGCPDATIRHGHLVPLCISDQIIACPRCQE